LEEEGEGRGLLEGEAEGEVLRVTIGAGREAELGRVSSFLSVRLGVGETERDVDGEVDEEEEEDDISATLEDNEKEKRKKGRSKIKGRKMKNRVWF
jgi:hypothetical protein